MLAGMVVGRYRWKRVWQVGQVATKVAAKATTER